MDRIQIDKIKRTFTPAVNCTDGMACLASIVRFYDNRFPLRSLFSHQSPQEDQITLARIREIATEVNLTTDIRLYSIEQLEKLQTPAVLLFENEIGEQEFVICYGMYGQRFVIGEPSFGLMQYPAQEIEKMWIRGITLIVFPNPVFFKS
ncbi:MAG: cysteine peptidase family C39 domain-containing protein [Bacteroides sp.]|nr:cysteine peptidase family C39 domain-containing protein [Bacteroides sp.]